MRVLIAIDDSDCSGMAFESVLARNWPEDVELRVITVVEPVHAQYAVTAGYIEPMIEAQREFTAYCQKMIEKKVGQLKRAFPKGEVSGEVIEGNVSAAILTEASQWNADVLVVGSHGRRGLEKFLLGSVAERVATHAPCSVEIIKQKRAAGKKSPKEAANTALV